MNAIPILDVRPAYMNHKAEIDAAVKRVLESGIYIQGEEVSKFESDFAQYCESEFAVGVGNGLDALKLSLLALGVSPGDEVIVPGHTFIATWLAVSACGAHPVPVEPVENGFNIDATRIESAITSRTKAIIAVHLYGEPCDLDSIIAIARKHELFLVEDAAQAHGVCYQGKKIGAHSDLVTWSFYPGKNLGAIGDGGCVTTNNMQLANRVRQLGNYGSEEKYVHSIKGFNSRLDPVQAAVLSVKLKYLDQANAHRCRIAERYSALLANSGLTLPTTSNSVWHQYVIRSQHRDDLAAHLRSCGVGTLVHYPIPPHLQAAYVDMKDSFPSLPLTTRVTEEALSLPIGPHLSIQDCEEICRHILSWPLLDRSL